MSGAAAILGAEGFEDLIPVTIHSAQRIRCDRHIEMLSCLDVRLTNEVVRGAGK